MSCLRNRNLNVAVLLIAGASLFTPAALGRVCDQAPSLAAGGLQADDSGSAESVVIAPSPFYTPSSTLTTSEPAIAGQTSSNPTTESKAASKDEQNKNLKVNPLTGLVTTTASGYQPLTGDQRWKLYWKMNYYSVGAYFGPFFNALLLDQATGSPSQWGGGFAGYGRRVASRAASAIIQGTFQAPAAAVLHEDVRYIGSTEHTFRRRAVHAIKYSFLTYNSQGHPTLNVANLAAYYAATAVSTTWLPGERNLAGYTFSNATEQVALTVPVNLLQEFWPEVRRTLLRRP